LTENKQLSPGDEIESKCLKCKNVTNHNIFAMDGETIVKVRCKVCSAMHRYRPPVELKKQAALPTRKTGGRIAAPKSLLPAAEQRKVTQALALFTESVAGRDLARAIPYSMTAAFRENELIQHPNFGLGLVLKTIRPDKIEVRFHEGTKILVCHF